MAINSFEMKSMKTILPAVWTSKAYCEALLKGKTLSAHYSYASGMAMPGEDGEVQGFEANMLRLYNVPFPPVCVSQLFFLE